MEMILDILCFGIFLFFCFFFKSLSPLRQLCLAFLTGRGEGTCFGDALRQDNEPSWSLGSGWAWLWVRPSAEPSLCAFSNLREEDLGEKRLTILSFSKDDGTPSDPEAAKPMDLEGQCRPGALCVLLSDWHHMSVPSVTQDPGTFAKPGRHQPQERRSCLVECELRVKNKFP